MAIAIGEAISKAATPAIKAVQDTIVARGSNGAAERTLVFRPRPVLSGAARGDLRRAGPRRGGQVHRRTGRSGATGPLMRTTPIALAYLTTTGPSSRPPFGQRAHRFDPTPAMPACCWTVKSATRVLTAELDARVGLRHLDPDRRAWSERLDIARVLASADIDRNRWTVAAPQARVVGGPPAYDARSGRSAPIFGQGWTPRCAPAMTPTPSRPSPAVCSERPTVPPGACWNGGCCCTAPRCARTIWSTRFGHARRGKPDAFDFSYFDSPSTRWRFTRMTTRCCSAASGCCASSQTRSTRWSRCAAQPTTTCAATSRTSRRGWSTDQRMTRTHLDFVLTDAVRAVERLRDEGRTVPVDTAWAPTAAPPRWPPHSTAPGDAGISTEQALRHVQAALPWAHPNPAFRATLLAGSDNRRR